MEEAFGNIKEAIPLSLLKKRLVENQALFILNGKMDDMNVYSAFSDKSGTFDHRFQSMAVVSS